MATKLMMEVPQHEPWLGDVEYAAIKDCFDRNWVTEGKKSQEFMDRIRELMGVEYCVLAPNGTLALYLALRAIGIGPGDEVIVPNFTFIASATSVEMVGATPVFCDVDPYDLQFSCKEAEKVLTSKTKAIMPVHLFGGTVDMDAVMAFAKTHGLKVVEDAAQAVGVHYSGKHCGTFGEVGAFSFFSDKTITMGEGGLVITNDEAIYNKLRYLRNQGRLNRGSFQHPEIGYNFRTTDILAAIGIEQLKKLPEIVRRKHHLLALYQKHLSDVEQVRFVPVNPKTEPHIPFRVCIMVDEPSTKLMDFLKDQGIQPRSFFYPLHKQECFQNLPSKNREFPHSVQAYEQGICLPCFPTMRDEQVEYLCGAIREYFHV